MEGQNPAEVIYLETQTCLFVATGPAVDNGEQPQEYPQMPLIAVLNPR